MAHSGIIILLGEENTKMSLDFGNIESVQLFAGDVQITGHKWVALAFAHDDAYLVTRLVNVHPSDLTPEQIDILSDAADVYDSNITLADGRSIVQFTVNGSIELVFRCEKVLQETRYYNAPEIENIFRWLPSRSTTFELATYIADIRAHGFEVHLCNEGVQVTRIDTEA